MKRLIDSDTGCSFDEIGEPCWRCKLAVPEHDNGLCDECFLRRELEDHIDESIMAATALDY